MSLGLKIGEEFLELPPEAEMQMELNNPLLDFGNDIVGEYSYPISAKLTPKNLKILQGSGLLQKRETNPGIEAQAYDGTLQYSTGKLKIEKTQPNLNNRNNTGLNLIYLSGYSSFYQDIKDLKLKDIDVGGDRTFANDNFDVNGAGWWGHIHQVVNGGAGYGTSGYDYAFYPVANEEFNSNGLEFLNLMEYSGGMVQFNSSNAQFTWVNRIVPFPYLKYILFKAVQFAGWRIEGNVLDDPQFARITLINSLAVNWGWKAGLVYHINTMVKFNLADHLPAIAIADFMLWLKNRFGWWYNFDRKKKLITVTQMKDSLSGEQKDFTKYTNPILEKTVLSTQRVYKLLVGSSNSAISFSSVNIQADVNKKTDLPAASEAQNNYVRLVVDENVYYINQQKDDASGWEWALFAENTGSYIPADAEEEINTNTYLPTMARYPSGDLLPQWNEAGYQMGRSNEIDYSAPFVLCFYYGLRASPSSTLLPFASHHIYDSNGVEVGTWSLSFKAKKFDGTQVGLYDLNWKKALDKLSVGEEVEVNLVDFPVEEWLNLKWNDELIIDGVKLYIKTQKPVIRFKKTLDLVCIRL